MEKGDSPAGAPGVVPGDTWTNPGGPLPGCARRRCLRDLPLAMPVSSGPVRDAGSRADRDRRPIHGGSAAPVSDAQQGPFVGICKPDKQYTVPNQVNVVPPDEPDVGAAGTVVVGVGVVVTGEDELPAAPVEEPDVVEPDVVVPVEPVPEVPEPDVVVPEVVVPVVPEPEVVVPALAGAPSTGMGCGVTVPPLAGAPSTGAGCVVDDVVGVAPPLLLPETGAPAASTSEAGAPDVGTPAGGAPRAKTADFVAGAGTKATCDSGVPGTEKPTDRGSDPPDAARVGPGAIRVGPDAATANGGNETGTPSNSPPSAAPIVRLATPPATRPLRPNHRRRP